MITELDTLFSDFDFFDQLLVDLKGKPDLNYLVDQLLQQKDIKSNCFEASGFRVVEDVDLKTQKNDIEFYFKLKEKNPNDYNPTSIVLKYDIDKLKYQVFSISYIANNKLMRLFCLENESDKTLINQRKVEFYNNKEKISLNIKFENKTCKWNLSYHKNDKNLHYEKFNNYLSSLNISGIEDSVKLINILTKIELRSYDESELDYLKYEFNLENCMYSGYLNKAATAFKNKKLNNKRDML